MIRANLFHHGRHMRDAELGPVETKCRLCRYAGTRATVAPVQSNPEVVMQRCPSCGATSASRMPTDDALTAYYSQYYDTSDVQYTFSGADRFGRHLARAFGRLLDSHGPLRVLDFGGGDGSIAAALINAARASAGGAGSVVVVDPGGVARSGSIGAVRIAHVPALEMADGLYDVVIASAILEHVPDAGQALGALLEKLRVGGLFYARTPWVLPLAKRLRRFDFGFPAHVHDLGGDYWKSAAKQHDAKMSVVHSRPSIVENSLRDAPIRALLAHTLKAPAHLEIWLRSRPAIPQWQFVGGWEVVWQKTPR